MSAETKYIIVDDDPLNNTICSLMLKRTIRKVVVKTFTAALEGLAFIKNNYINNLIKPSVLLLDINMPTLTGWDFLRVYENFSDEIKGQVHIYLLSSSINQRDRDRAKTYSYIKGFVSKPLTTEGIRSIEENEFKMESKK